jgi:hypothetical protein
MDANRRGGAVLAAPPRLTPVHNIKLTETRRDYALSVGASRRGEVRAPVHARPVFLFLTFVRWFGFADDADCAAAGDTN